MHEHDKDPSSSLLKNRKVLPRSLNFVNPSLAILSQWMVLIFYMYMYELSLTGSLQSFDMP